MTNYQALPDFELGMRVVERDPLAVEERNRRLTEQEIRIDAARASWGYQSTFRPAPPLPDNVVPFRPRKDLSYADRPSTTTAS